MLKSLNERGLLGLFIVEIIVGVIGVTLIFVGALLFLWQERIPIVDHYAYRIVFPYQHLAYFMWSLGALFLLLMLVIALFGMWREKRLKRLKNVGGVHV